MEYTKDMILGVRYEKDYDERKKGWTSSFANTIKNHKFITTAVVSAVIFISIDVVLITNFFRILNML